MSPRPSRFIAFSSLWRLSCAGLSGVLFAAPGALPAVAEPTPQTVPQPVASAAPWTPVNPVDFQSINVDDFQDGELELIPYLAHFHRVANAVTETGPERGFIKLHVWRGLRDNQPYNARIQENVLSLAWFYTADRPWNPYRGHPAVRVRLEAALEFISGSQAPDGAFSEYTPAGWNLAATGFMTKFLGETLELLNAPGAPAIAPAVLARAHATERKAILAVLERPDFYEAGRTFTNQFGNVWPGGLAWLRLHPEDTEVRELWDRRLRQSREDFQSPAGFFYEANGPDFGYTLGTHGSNSRAAWPYIKDGALAAAFTAKERSWFDWLAYNLVSEPGESWFAVNRAIETRTPLPFYAPIRREVHRRGTPFPDEVPLSVAFSATREEQAAHIAAERARLRLDWPGAGPLQTGFWSYSPYVFLYLGKPAVFPTTAARDTIRARLPYLARGTFNHARHDSRKQASFLFARRPSYYATFATGNIASQRQRYGLGLLWHPRTGVILQSEPNSDSLCWGVVPAGTGRTVESQSFQASVTAGDRRLEQLPAAADLPEGDLLIDYPLPGGGGKSVRFSSDSIAVTVRLAGGFAEQLPLTLAEGETVEIGDGVIAVRGPRGDRLILRLPGTGAVATQSEHPSSLPGRRLVRLNIEAHDRLTYSLHLPAPPDKAP